MKLLIKWPFISLNDILFDFNDQIQGFTTTDVFFFGDWPPIGLGSDTFLSVSYGGSAITIFDC